MGRKKIPTTVYVLPEQKAELDAIKAHSNIPVAELHRQAIEVVIRRHKRHTLRQPTSTELELEESRKYAEGLSAKLQAIKELVADDVGSKPSWLSAPLSQPKPAEVL